MIRFEPVALQGSLGDEEAVLVFWDNRLLAVLCCLGELHGDLEGSWFTEAQFGTLSRGLPMTFASLEEAEMWLARPDGAGLS